MGTNGNGNGNGKIGTRNAVWEREFLVWACRQAGVDGGEFRQQVQAGLALGKERYGDTAYLDRDNYLELIQESRDQAAYALMEAQRLYIDELEGKITMEEGLQIRTYLGHICQLAAMADHYAKEARDIWQNA